MSENNKSYRLRTRIGVTQDSEIQDKYLTVKLTDEIDSIDIMSLKIKQENAYKFHSADYGVVVGRAIANGGFGVPNVKVSVFIAATEATKNDAIYNAIYPYERVTQKNTDNIRYNLLPDVGNDDCYQVVGTFPNKRLVLDDDNYMEIYDTYYKFTTRTNNAGDYMIFGIPTGGQILHFDTDLSDVGILSQKPRDMVYKGYNIRQFENPNQFKKDDNLANLPQIISQDESVYIYPFWGDEDENIIGITRHDININYKFEPTCVFIGSIVSDSNSNHISKKCIPTAGMGVMEDLITGPGTIEMIRKKQNGEIEQFNVQGTQLIDEAGKWCYQIPMNLDYMMTDEYGNLVPSDDPTKGIATRAKVRFRISMDDFQNDSLNSFRAKVLVPNNPQNTTGRPDYVFGSFTEDESFRDLLWNNVYTVKSFIPRFQKGNGNNNRRFSGVKQCNYHGQNNPIPYNNMRINLSFQFVITCLLVKLMIKVVGLYNSVMTAFANMLGKLINSKVMKAALAANDWFTGAKTIGGKIIRIVVGLMKPGLTVLVNAVGAIGKFFRRIAQSLSCIYIDGEMCEALEGEWFFAPNCGKKGTIDKEPYKYLWLNMFGKVEGKKLNEMDYSSKGTKDGGGQEDKMSIDTTNADDLNDEDSMVTLNISDGQGNVTTVSKSYVITRGINYFLQCIEISLAQEFRVIQFDFYNDWINGMIYIPRWERNLKRKRKYFLLGKSRVEVRACNDTYQKRFFERKNNLTEQCSVSYRAKNNDNSVGTKVGCKNNKKYKCHKKKGRHQFRIFRNGGVVHSEMTASGLYAYYFKPCEMVSSRNTENVKRVNLFATDLVLLGSLVDCDLNGTPLFTNELTSTTYQIPSPLAHTDSTEEGFTYEGNAEEKYLLTEQGFGGVYDYSDTLLNPTDDGSMTEESGIDWGYTGPGQGEVKKPKTYTPGGHFLGISCVNSETSIKSCVNLKRICEIGVWPSSRQEVFNGYDANNTGQYVDIIPNGLISRDDISGGNFRKLFSTMNNNNLRMKVNESGFTVYDFYYMNPENFGGDLNKYAKNNYNAVIPLDDESMAHYLASKADDVDEDGNTWGTSETEAASLNVKPLRRALEERDADYMKFRLGLTGNTNTEIQRKYLGLDDYGYYMPVYNNSFYFYFGLVPGATALDEFHRQFFSECKHTITGSESKLFATFPYKKNPSDTRETDAFEDGIVLSIFDAYFDADAHNGRLRVFTSSVPLKVIVDGDVERSLVVSDSDAVRKSYIEIDNSYLPGIFDFEVGVHTITITDAEGRSVTKLVEVRQEKVTLCPDVDGYDFQDSDYAVNSTRTLVNGTAPNRERLGGQFNFTWNNPDCGDYPTLFTYEDNGTVNSVAISNACIVFVGKSHIIKFGNWSHELTTTYEEFNGYAPESVYNGASVTNSGPYHIYAGEEGNYAMYILYSNGGRETPFPILVEGNIYIGEPDIIDFDIFREVLESEDDSPVTFRNPIIKVWYNNRPDWYTHLYGSNEFTYDQIWYVKKTMFFIFHEPISGTEAAEDMDDYRSNRDLYINAFYPSEIGNVEVKVTGGTSAGYHYLRNIQWDDRYQIQITGRTTGGEIITVPKGTMFSFPILYKPFYYKVVVWEGYSVFTEDDPARLQNYLNGHVYGTIYNGITYDRREGGATKSFFGPAVLNDSYDLTNYITPQFMGDSEFLSARTTPIKVDMDYIGEVESSFLITEGAPNIYEDSYLPCEYRISTPTVSGPSNWTLDLTLVHDKRLASPCYSTREMKVTTVNDYEEFYGYTITTLDSKFYTDAEYGENPADRRITGVSTINPDGETEWSFTFPYDWFSANPKVIIIGESKKKDDLIYQMPQNTQRLGYLKSRNIIRNNLLQNFSMKSGDNAMFVRIKVVKADEPKNKKAVEKMVIDMNFLNIEVAEQFGESVEEVTVVWDGVSYDLVGELGYYVEYLTGGKLLIQISEVTYDNKDVIVQAVDDRFTTKVLNNWPNGRKTKDIEFEKLIIKSNGVGEHGKTDINMPGFENYSYNNIIDTITFTEIKCDGEITKKEVE